MATETTDTASSSVSPGEGPRTLAALWQQAISEDRGRPAYLVQDGGAWREVSWGEAARRVDELAHGFLSLGVKKGDPFAILARTRLEWALLDFALLSIGAVVVPIYPTSSQGEIEYILRHSDAIGLAVEDSEHAAQVSQRRAELPRLEHVLTFSDLDDLASRGRDHLARDSDALERVGASITEDDPLTCMYTSGTTGPPKGCLLSHRNYYVMTTIIEELPDIGMSNDRMLLYLPLAHTFGRLMHFWGAREGFTIAFCPDPQQIAPALEEVRPTLLPSVPRMFEKVHTAVLAQFDAATGVRRRLVGWSLSVGRRASRLQQQSRRIPPGLAAQLRIADRLVFSKVKNRLGGELRFAISGGAPLAREVAEFFHALDIVILEGYGQTEGTTACAVNLPRRFRFGTVGPVMPRCEVRIAEDGEILVRGETVFAGYLKDTEATRTTLTDDGWLKTGDIGALDPDGFLTITDRKKDILVTAGGKNVAPQNIENALKGSKYVSQALVLGDRRPYIAALVTLDVEEMDKWAAQAEPPVEGPALAVAPQVRELIQEVVNEVNGNLARHEQIKRFQILERDFSAEDGEVTPTLKLKRRVCEDHFAAEIENLYRS